MAVLRIGRLPEESLAAAAAFHADFLPDIRGELDAGPDHLTLVFAPADYRHRGWMLAVVQDLARLAAPLRVNALVSDEEEAIAAAAGYVARAEGLTGQLFHLDGNGAGEVLCAES